MRPFSARVFSWRCPDFEPGTALRRLMEGSRSSQGFALETEDARYLAAAPFEVLRVRRGKAYRENGGRRAALSGNPFQALGSRLSEFRLSGRTAPWMTGAFGMLSYEMTRHLEKLPFAAQEDEASVLVFPWILRWQAGRAELCSIEGVGPASKSAALAERALAASPIETWAANGSGLSPVPGGLGKAGFLRGVKKLKEHIRAGDIFQGVLSEPFVAPYSGGPWRLFSSLRRSSPAAPYLFLYKDGERAFLGASPERLVQVKDGMARNYPIAGTRPRGETAARDKALERQLLRSPKERAEHLMLVDLARNDLGRVCRPGTVKVTELMKLRRFSNVMHLVSEVEGKLEKGRDCWDALASSFPAGTVSGAPKVRAMELLSGLEPKARGFYAGAFFQRDFSGNLDSCIAIRSLELYGGKARLQAGAGIVADSRPEAEFQEIVNKLAGLRRALAAA
jgi:anthranilate synthase component I